MASKSSVKIKEIEYLMNEIHGMKEMINDIHEKTCPAKQEIGFKAREIENDKRGDNSVS